ncbi:MAG: ATPase, partial [Halapricum sp.]
IRATVVEDPTVDPAALDPRSWCAMLDLDPTGAAGSLVWRAAQEGPARDESAGLAAMREGVRTADADPAARRAADNHLALAAGWGAFAKGGLDAATLGTGAATVVDVSGLAAAPLNAVCRGIAEALYRGRVSNELQRLPWLLVDEAHALFAGVAAPALERILTRGRAPGVSLVLATQRPSAVPAVGVSQADVLVAHRLTSEADLEALARARPTYLETSLEARLPTGTGEVVIVDDATETVHAAAIRERVTPHEGESPSLRERRARKDNREVGDEVSRPGRKSDKTH